ncbi:hypothetical protein XELAEV_18013816mg [Xenopus laevis]|uniref:Uncharacterized protein n=1 Tax=Xenopus laevis TaxID=8355 RepID=A0A974DQD3_XENLA|nr:hypothetical protein XELAEV_18013816mg [Xenopus laevis]
MLHFDRGACASFNNIHLPGKTRSHHLSLSLRGVALSLHKKTIIHMVKPKYPAFLATRKTRILPCIGVWVSEP